MSGSATGKRKARQVDEVARVRTCSDTRAYGVPGSGRQAAEVVSSTRRSVLGGSLRALAVPLLAFLLVMLAGTPARAHDVLIGSDPKDGAVLTEMPGSVTLTFDQAVRRDFARIAVTGPDGALYQQGEVTAQGKNVSIGVRSPAPAGTYAIGYRIVSNDGHPVTGTVKFTLAPASAAPAGTPTAAPTATPTAAPPLGATATASAPAGGTGTDAGGPVPGAAAAGGQGGGGWVWGLLVVAMALLALSTMVLVRHDRRTRSATSAGGAA